MEIKERKLKLENIPYIRIWANLLNYEGRERRKDFIIDLGLLILAQVLLFVLIYLLLRLNLTVIFIILMTTWSVTFFLQMLSLFARRLVDVGMKYGYTFFLFALITFPFLLMICLGKSEDEIDGNDLKKRNRRRIVLLTVPLYIVGVAVLLLFLAFIALLLYGIIVGHRTIKESTNIDEYEEIISEVNSASDIMPSLDNLNSYTDIKFGYKKLLYSKLLGFESDDISLFITYGDNYNDEKEKVISNYEFLSEEDIYDNGKYYFPLANFEYKGYVFQIVSNDGYSYCLCKSFMLLGYNDDKNTIVYLYFYDNDLDYLYNETSRKTREEAMYDFIEDSFIWYD